MKKNIILGIVITICIVASVLLYNTFFSTTQETNVEELVNGLVGEYIGLSDNGSITNSDSVSIDDNEITIEEAGTYTIVGTLNDGQVIVDCDDETTLVLAGVTIHNEDGAAIFISDSDTTITLLEDTVNKLSDGDNYKFTEEEINATLYSKDDLVIDGNGTLEIEANFEDGIVSKDTLTINSGEIIVNAIGDAIYGKDSISINDGTVNIITGGGAEKAPITAGEEEFPRGPRGETTTEITETEDGESLKGLKSQGDIIINAGEFILDTYDDAIHSDTEIVINDGSFDIMSGDDAIHANNVLTINNGNFNITYTYEGLESKNIIINDGNYYINALDDGMNAPTDVKNSFSHPDYSDFDKEVDSYIEINGGTFELITYGDGIDANGGVEINGGYITAESTYRTQKADSGVDFDNTGYINGGTLLTVTPEIQSHELDNDSSQVSFECIFGTVISSGTEISIIDSNGNELISYTPSTDFETIIFSSPDLAVDESYTIKLGSNSFTVTLIDTVSVFY